MLRVGTRVGVVVVERGGLPWGSGSPGWGEQTTVTRVRPYEAQPTGTATGAGTGTATGTGTAAAPELVTCTSLRRSRSAVAHFF